MLDRGQSKTCSTIKFREPQAYLVNQVFIKMDMTRTFCWRKKKNPCTKPIYWHSKNKSSDLSRGDLQQWWDFPAEEYGLHMGDTWRGSALYTSRIKCLFKRYWDIRHRTSISELLLLCVLWEFILWGKPPFYLLVNSSTGKVSGK